MNKINFTRGLIVVFFLSSPLRSAFSKEGCGPFFTSIPENIELFNIEKEGFLVFKREFYFPKFKTSVEIQKNSFFYYPLGLENRTIKKNHKRRILSVDDRYGGTKLIIELEDNVQLILDELNPPSQMLYVGQFNYRFKNVLHLCYEED